MKKLFALLLCIATLLVCLPTTVFAVTTISSLEIADLPEPRPGNPIPVSVTINTPGAELYSVEWYDVTANKWVYSGSDYYIEGHVYKVNIWVEAKSGYEFRYTNSYTPNVSASIMGTTVNATKAYEYNAWAMVVISYTFAPCANKTIQSVNIELSGLKKDERGILCATENDTIPFYINSVSDAVQVYPALNTNRYYPYGFHWTNLTKNTTASYGDRFKGGCDYYVTIAIEPVGATFANNLAVTINGKDATFKSKGETYAEVSIEFVCFGSISGSTIGPVVSLPKAGENPNFQLSVNSTGIDYAYVDGWYDVETGKQLCSDDTFVGGKQYQVKIFCQAAYGHKFDKDANGNMKRTPSISGIEVDSYILDYDDYRGREVIILSKTFTAEGGQTQSHTHTPSQWRTTGIYHYKTCTTCGEFLEQEDHKGGKATCNEKGKCSVCGYAYIEENENHTPDTSKWIARADMYHYHACKGCGAHCDVSDHVASPTSSPDAAVVCKDCGYVITPAKNHKHTLTKQARKEASCTEPGMQEHYICDGCSDLFFDSEGKNKVTDPETLTIAPTGHTLSEYWQKNSENHWRTCTVCKADLDETKTAHDLNSTTCATCGYIKGEPVRQPSESEQGEQPNFQDKEPTGETTAGQNEEENENNDWLPILLVALVCFAAAITATVIILKKKKK